MYLISMNHAFKFINSVLRKKIIYKLRAVNSYNQAQSLYFTFYKEMFVWVHQIRGPQAFCHAVVRSVTHLSKEPLAGCIFRIINLARVLILC